ncbi:class I SAM-dependent methyltransferase [Plastoroseomonas arctica]|uniref:Class I SAM-dependent methyltransferase n=1 Tax=Plastoroseomonas arctica TaxID=1509237 RepID=A0AAF1KKE9_9PROT|nr:class I SAM-dependent methyltransferase [Plastoroseomonas arctica]MBR0656445.1 class I SAM-dependent methyltransferase [Plastoroseomonas arctica]
MSQPTIRFDDGAVYERAMGVWSRDAGQTFLDWLAPEAGLAWVDVGCGNGAFTELLMERCAPSEAQGIDPSEGQISFARLRAGAEGAVFQQGDAMALPFPDHRFDAAVMALVIFFVPDPAKGVAEMVRVTRPGGMVTAYAWDILGGGFPFDPIQREMRLLGGFPALPPNAAVSTLPALHALWTAAGLEEVETREIIARRSFDDFEDFWISSTGSGGMNPSLAAMAPGDVDLVKSRVGDSLTIDASGRIQCQARANAVRGRVPGSPQ